MSEADERARVVAAARDWIGTPYHNCADIKGGGVDCGMLLVRVFVDCGLCEPFDPRPYSADWHLHRSDERYLGFVFDHTAEVEKPLPGDVAVFKFGRCYAHGGIITTVNPTRLVHAYSLARAVVEEPLSTNVALMQPKRAVRYFSYWSKRNGDIQI